VTTKQCEKVSIGIQCNLIIAESTDTLVDIEELPYCDEDPMDELTTFPKTFQRTKITQL